METKKSYLSKTYWTNFLLAAGVLVYPPLADFISQNPELTALIYSGINMLLRRMTKDKLELY